MPAPARPGPRFTRRAAGLFLAGALAAAAASAAAAAPLDHLPARCGAVLRLPGLADGLAAAKGLLGALQSRARVDGIVRGWAAALASATGSDLTDPATLAALGIDPAADLFLAVHGTAYDEFVVAVGARPGPFDRAPLEKALRAVSGFDAAAVVRRERGVEVVELCRPRDRYGLRYYRLAAGAGGGTIVIANTAAGISAALLAAAEPGWAALPAAPAFRAWGPPRAERGAWLWFTREGLVALLEDNVQFLSGLSEYNPFANLRAGWLRWSPRPGGGELGLELFLADWLDAYASFGRAVLVAGRAAPRAVPAALARAPLALRLRLSPYELFQRTIDSQPDRQRARTWAAIVRLAGLFKINFFYDLVNNLQPDLSCWVFGAGGGGEGVDFLLGASFERPERVAFLLRAAVALGLLKATVSTAGGAETYVVALAKPFLLFRKQLVVCLDGPRVWFAADPAALERVLGTAGRRPPLVAESVDAGAVALAWMLRDPLRPGHPYPWGVPELEALGRLLGGSEQVEADVSLANGRLSVAVRVLFAGADLAR